jgi:16S rRNA (guanine966-N2)-methyltransferase
MDPPYNQDLAPPALAALHRAGWLAPGALATVELMAKEPFTPPEGFEILEERKYGKARLVFSRAPG